MKQLALASLLLSAAAGAAEPRITIERATVPWSELERLLRREGGGQASPRPAAPSAYALTADVDGEVASGRARLTVVARLSVLQDRWTIAPLLPAGFAVARGEVSSPAEKRGLLVRSAEGVSLAAEGAGDYRVELEAEGPMERTAAGERLVLSPPGLSGGTARISLEPGRAPASGAWRVTRSPGGVLVAEAPLGAAGLVLALGPREEKQEAGTTLEDLQAVTVLSLGGGGVTRLSFRAYSEEGEMILRLPAGARPWKAFVGLTPVRLPADGEVVRLPFKGPATVELAYTFEGQPLGIRGRWRLELARLPAPVRGARWQVWLPAGVRYRDTQSSLANDGCSAEGEGARIALELQGSCLGFARPVLGPGAAFVEGAYEQRLGP